MYVSKLKLTNFRRFEDLEMSFLNENGVSKMNIIFANNGGGKTTILESIRDGLTWFGQRMSSPHKNGQIIDELDIRNNSNFSSIDIAVQYEGSFYSWNTSRIVAGKIVLDKSAKSDFSGLNSLTGVLRERFTEDPSISLPVLLYYSVDRSSIKVPKRNTDGQESNAISEYSYSLRGAAESKRFFNWFEKEQDAEEQRILQNILRNPSSASSDEISNIRQDSESHGLRTVRESINIFMQDYTDLHVDKTSGKKRITMKKDGEVFLVEQFSQGEKSLLTLVGDIARNLAIANPHSANPRKEGKGIVLIDEVDLHLHPAWQKNIVERLHRAFPKCQFIVTTHSPLVINGALDANIYSLDDESVEIISDNRFYSRDIDETLWDAMEVNSSRLQDETQHIVALIAEQRWDEAEEEIAKLKDEVGEKNMVYQKLAHRKENLFRFYSKN